MNNENGIESDRNATIKAIKTALQRRSGKSWSVTGGRGTAWGWITIDAPPARRTAGHDLRPGSSENWPENYVRNDNKFPEGGATITDADQKELAALLGLDSVHCQGVSIPASSEYRREYLDRAQGKTPSVIAQPYWD